jgi:tryptophanyl-tRNA synthetase
MWILSTVASTGQLSRMTQWKVESGAPSVITSWNNDYQSKLELSGNSSLEDAEARAKLKLGLFSYPVLQAADILVHRQAP